MGKRLQRIGNSEIPANKQRLLNIDLHVVLNSGATYYGIIDVWDKESVVFTDFRNRKHHFLITDVFEIVFDQLAAY